MIISPITKNRIFVSFVLGLKCLNWRGKKVIRTTAPTRRSLNQLVNSLPCLSSKFASWARRPALTIRNTAKQALKNTSYNKINSRTIKGREINLIWISLLRLHSYRRLTCLYRVIPFMQTPVSQISLPDKSTSFINFLQLLSRKQQPVSGVRIVWSIVGRKLRCVRMIITELRRLDRGENGRLPRPVSSRLFAPLLTIRTPGTG